MFNNYLPLSIQVAKIGKFCRTFANMNGIVAKTQIRIIILALASIFCTIPVSANKIKVLPTDKSVREAVMPNGLKCYVVASPTQKGRADFALVQNTGIKTASDVDDARLKEIARESLASQPRLLSPSVQEFFTSHGASAGKDGFVKVTDDATIFHFRNVDISSGSGVADSTLLVLMGIVDRITFSQDTALRKWYTPADQAVIVAGDVDAAKVVDKLRTLSYMVPGFDPESRREYVWKDSLDVQAEVLRSSAAGLSSLTARWRLPRTPKSNMNTVQPLVVDMYMTQLAVLAERRIKAALMQEGIPYAAVSCSYDLPVNYLDDDAFSVEVKVDSSNFRTAVELVASAISSVANGNITETEQGDAENIYFDGRLSYVRSFSNAMHVRRCASAFLYNESLASEQDKNEFLMKRFVPDSTELKIFKSIVSASLPPDRNLSLRCSSAGHSMTSDTLKALFAAGWDHPWTEAEEADATDRTGICEINTPAEPVKVKVKSSRKEYLSGGVLYTLSNGLKVVVKPTDAKDVIYWSLALNGGYGHIEDLEVGEASYLSEFLYMCRIGGVPAEAFKDGIRRMGVTMDVDVTHSRTTFGGRVPDDGLADLMRSLLTLADTFEPHEDYIKYRMECEPLAIAAAAGSLEDRIAVIDSVMCPGYRYSNRKEGFDMDFIRKAETFYRELFAKMDDGVLVLVGDVDEKVLKQVLVKFAGLFRTSGLKASRPVVNYQPISGTVMLEREGRENGVDMVMSAPMSLTAENRYLAEIASMYLQKNLSDIVVGRGLHVRIRHHCGFYPQERVSMMLSLREASVEGFAPGTSHHEPMEALTAVRDLLKDMKSVELTDAGLASYKAFLKQKVKRRQADPEYWHEAIAMRYIDGKDFTTGYEAKIDALTVDDVKTMLGLLSKGARVEYVMNKK